MQNSDKIRLLIIQYGGNYRDAYKNLASGGKETYSAQKYCVDLVTDLARQGKDVSFICCNSPEPYNEVLDNGVRAIGAGQKVLDIAQLIQIAADQQPTHLITDVIDRRLLQWAMRHSIKTLAIMSNSVTAKGLRGKVKNLLLAKTLNQSGIEWVCSYGLTLSLKLKQLGVQAGKIIPWDFLISSTPGNYDPKSLKSIAKLPQLIYVGSLVDSKGIPELLEAVSRLHQRQLPVRLKIVGKDASVIYQKLAETFQIADFVEFVGIMPTEKITPLMHEADVVVVPSRHDYPEGFPLVINHALCSRTPLVVSDHPMFKMYLKHQVNAMMFSANHADDLANQISALLSNAYLYNRLSHACYRTWYQMRLPVKWGSMIQNWLADDEAARGWFLKHSLAFGNYELPANTPKQPSRDVVRQPEQANAWDVARTVGRFTLMGLSLLVL